MSGSHTHGSLELRRDSDGSRYYLCDREIAHGSRIELLLADGRWLHGVFEWSGVEARWPGLRFDLAFPAENPRRLTAVCPIPPGANVRWAVSGSVLVGADGPNH